MKKILAMLAILTLGVCAAAGAAEEEGPKPLVLLDEADSIAKWSGIEAVSNPVKTGKVSGRFTGPERGTQGRLTAPPGDWSAYNVLAMEMHSAVANDAAIILTLTSKNENDAGDYFIHTLKVDWKGWKTVRIPFSSFGSARSPKGWNSIDAINFNFRGWNHEPKADTRLAVDNMRLEHSKDIAMKPKKIAREPEKKVSLTPYRGALRYVGFPWEEVKKRAEEKKEAGVRLSQLVKRADTIVDKPIRVRHYKLEDVPESQRDGRYKNAGKNGEVFVLAMYDCGTANHLKNDLVAAAIAARLTGEKKYLDYCIEQLREAATWVPFQRPGWTAYNPDRVLPEGGDGNWLATGNAINGVVETLDILGDRLPEDLRAKLRENLQREIDSIVDDWETKRPWFVKADFPATNQWVLPLSGMVYACLYLGDAKNLDAYNMGISNLARTAVSMGEDGSWREGLSYGSFSAEHVFWAAWAARRQGDDRLADFPFVQNYHSWMTHMLMPGRYAVNAFDCGLSTMSSRPDESLMLNVMLTESPEGFWAIQTLFDRLPATRLGLLFDYYVGDREKSDAVPIPWAYFPSQEVMTWRDSWNNRNAMGVWMRGGSTRDMHSHRDNGHISVYNGLNPVLIECGTCSYSDPDLNPKYAEAAGHNILQVGEFKPRSAGRPAPITVGTLNETGGEVTVDPTLAFPVAKSWIRKVRWHRDGWVRIADDANLLEEQAAGTEFFRFHTGTTLPLDISGSGKEWTAKWAGATIALKASRPVQVDQIEWPDRSGLGVHRCIRILVAETSSDLALNTEVRFQRKDNALRKLPTYEEYLAEVKKQAPQAGPVEVFKRVEAEDMTGDDPRFTITDKKVNAKVCFLNWDYVGQKVETEFDAPQDGFYQIMTRHCTGAAHGTPIRSLRIDGEIPFKEASEMVFPFTGGFSNRTDDWKYRVLDEEQVPGGFQIFLKKGKNKIGMVCEDGGGLNLDYIVVFKPGMKRETVIEKAQAME